MSGSNSGGVSRGVEGVKGGSTAFSIRTSSAAVGRIDSHLTTPRAVPNVWSPGFINPSSRTKSMVAEREGHACWLCMRTAVIDPTQDVAYLIARDAIAQFLYFQSISVLPSTLTRLAHADNLLLLCSSCRPAFDASLPNWVMLPTLDTINRYIQHEQRDYQSRTRAGRQGQMEARTLPVIDKAAVQYQPYILSQNFAANEFRLAPSNWPKVWGGEPIAAIIRASLGILQPCEPQDVSRPDQLEDVTIGVPRPVVTKCTQLITLWSRPPPPVIQLLETAPKGTKRGLEEEGSGESQDGDKGSGQRKSKGDTPQKKARVQAVPSDRMLGNRGSRGKMVYGPEHTSNDAISEAMAQQESKGVRKS